MRTRLLAAVLACLACAGAVAKTLLIDVRTPEEYAGGHIEGALNIDHQVITQRIGMAGAARTDEVQLYCRSGRRSALAAQRLREMGYTRVIDLGGMDAARTQLCLARGRQPC